MIKKIYVYVILFATLMMTIGGSVAAFMAIADIVKPTTYQQSFEQYKDNLRIMKNNEKAAAAEPALTDEQLKKNYESNIAQEKQNTRDRAINSLIKSLGWIIIPLPVFLYYQRRLKTLD